MSKIIPLGFLSIGVFLLLQVILPIISFQVWWFSQSHKNTPLINPSSSQVLGVSIQSRDNFPAIVSTLKRDSRPNYYQFGLTVPKLKIYNATVLVDSNDLSKYLAHLPGSALPGEKGNVFISGHSALSPFFSFKTALFASLTDLKKGDELTIDASGTKFKYEVLELKVVDPTDLSIISPPDPLGRYISLMTCVPPGLNLKRLVILGKML